MNINPLQERRISLLIQAESSQFGARKVIPDVLGAKLLLTPMAELGALAGDVFQAKTQQKLIVQAHIMRVMLQKTLLPTALQTNVKFKLPMELDFQNQLQLTLKLLTQRKNRLNKFIGMLKKPSISAFQI